MVKRTNPKGIKKVLFGILFTITFSFSSFTYTSCIGGTEITSNTSANQSSCTATTCPNNSKKFCKSNVSLNWWSAFDWCQSNGGTLASFETLCPGVPVRLNSTAGACPAMQAVSSDWVWTSLGYTSSNAFSINLSTGAINHFSRLNGYRAICE